MKKSYGVESFLAIIFVFMVALTMWFVWSKTTECYEKSPDKTTIGAFKCFVETLDELSPLDED